MASLLIDKQVDIYEYPTELDDNSGSITIGDLHGNSLKLIHFLLRHKIIAFKDDVDAKVAYKDFVAVYEQIGEVATDIHKAQRTIDYESYNITSIHEKNIARYDELKAKKERGESTAQETQEFSKINIDKLKNIKTEAEGKIRQAKETIPVIKLKFQPLVKQFNVFMSQLEVINEQSLVRLIGDELADRGSNDYFTLRVLGLLKSAGVNVHIIISNHSNEFITAYERLAQQQDFSAKDDIGDSQKMSFVGLKLLMDEQIVTETEVTELVTKAYKPCLKVLDYTLSDNGISLFSHAPISFKMIKHIAASFDVVYDDSSKRALATTIDKINTQFDQVVKDNRVHEWCNIHDDELFNDNMTEEQMQAYPLINIIWNRWSKDKDTDEARPASHNGYSINYLHGHDTYQSKYKHVSNLDTSCGKGSRKSIEEQVPKAEQAVLKNSPLKEEAQQFLDGINSYKVWDSDESALEQKHSLELIEKEFMQQQSMSNTARAGIISGVAAGIGLLLGAAIGIALVATGVFAPLGLGVLGIVAMAATLGGGASLVAGGLAFTVARASESAPVTTTVIEDAQPLIKKSSLSVMANGLGPAHVEPATQSTNRFEQEPKPQADVDVTAQSTHARVAEEQRSFSP